MRSLDQIRILAQQEADRAQSPMTIWNLNRFNPLYVVRETREHENHLNGYVETIKPDVFWTNQRAIANTVATAINSVTVDP